METNVPAALYHRVSSDEFIIVLKTATASKLP